MEITIDRDNTTLTVKGDIPMDVLLAFLTAEWTKPEYEGLPFPFTKLDFNEYKIVPPWILPVGTFKNIHGAGIATR